MAPAAHWLRLPRTLRVPLAATIAVNPCTAYRLLRDFVELRAGDAVILNGANSGVGEAVLQLARAAGIVAYGVVRGRVATGGTADAPRPDLAALTARLQQLGATHVFTDDAMGTRETRAMLEALPSGPPRLALDMVGGRSAADLIRALRSARCPVLRPHRRRRGPMSDRDNAADRRAPHRCSGPPDAPWPRRIGTDPAGHW